MLLAGDVGGTKQTSQSIRWKLDRTHPLIYRFAPRFLNQRITSLLI